MNDGVIELGWLEREFFATEKAKWDCVLFKVGNTPISSALIEFSDGCNDNTASSKNQHDIKKLYSNMLHIIKALPSQIFCIRYFDKSIYFEKLTMFEDSTFRTIEAPNTPRKLVDYTKELPNMLACD